VAAAQEGYDTVRKCPSKVKDGSAGYFALVAFLVHYCTAIDGAGFYIFIFLEFS
jgi:hypothetical protein